MSHRGEENSPSTGKPRLSLQLPAELVERVRDAVYRTPGLTLNELTEVALSHLMTYMEALCGETGTPRAGSLKVGRQVR